jgi:hypothetical protein
VNDETGARPATGTGGADLAARGCGCLAWAAALVMAFVVVSVLIIRHDLQPHDPDLRNLVNSAHLRSLDSAATGWTGQQAGQIEERAPWLSPHGDAVSDQCQLGASGGVFSVECDRTLFAFYGFNGSLPARLGELERALNGVGWSRFVPLTPVFPPPPSPAGGAAQPLASEAPPVRAEARPTNAGARPTNAVTPPSSTDALKIDIEVNWIARDQLNSPAVIDMGYLPTFGGNTTFVRHLHFRNVNVPSLARQIFRTHQYMLIIQIIAGYYHNPNFQASAPPSG